MEKLIIECKENDEHSTTVPIKKIMKSLKLEHSVIPASKLKSLIDQ